MADKMYPTYLENIEIDKDGTRTGFAIDITPSGFGKTSIKIQDSGQPHKETEYREID